MKDITFKNLADEQINAIKVLLGDACETEGQVEEEETPFPVTGDVFYSIFSDGEVDSCVFYDSSFDTDRISMGNCFRTEEEAEFEVERLKVIHSMKRFTEPKNYAWDGINYHYYFYYDHHQGEIKIGSSRYYKYGGIYFEAEVNAQNCMNAVGEDRIKKYYFGIKEEDKEIAF